ncbi:MAG: hypothetical protein VB024_10745 [Dysgonamonadaceae bacterium]|jgi:uncharacterized protein YxeA|nr:hypothetical protein [Dysgonamonadaceae bacterium]
MKKRVFIVLLTLSIISCSKKYQYSEFVKDPMTDSVYIQDSVQVIKAKNDTLAYLKAYEKYCFSQKRSKDMFDVTAKFGPMPDSFSLVNPQGKEISNIEFFSKDTMKTKIAYKVFTGKRTVIEKRYSIDQ